MTEYRCVGRSIKCTASFPTPEQRDGHEDRCREALIAIDVANNIYFGTHPLWAVAPDGMHHWVAEGDGHWLTDCGLALESPPLVYRGDEAAWARWPQDDEVCQVCADSGAHVRRLLGRP